MVQEYSIPKAIHDLQVVLESQYKDLKALEAQRVADAEVSKSVEYRNKNIESLENILGCINQACKDKKELDLLKTSTIQYIETFNTIFKQ
jgi:hypothetical protein